MGSTPATRKQILRRQKRGLDRNVPTKKKTFTFIFFLLFIPRCHEPTVFFSSLEREGEREDIHLYYCLKILRRSRSISPRGKEPGRGREGHGCHKGPGAPSFLRTFIALLCPAPGPKTIILVCRFMRSARLPSLILAVRKRDEII